MRIRTFAVVSVLILGATGAQSQNGDPWPDPELIARVRTQIPGRDLSLDPPRIASMVVEPLAQPTTAGNTLLRVSFAKDEVLPARLDYLVDDRVITLADDGKGVDAQAGDGIYSAVGSIDLNQFRGDLTTLAASPTAQPVSTFRARSRQETGAVLNPATLQPGAGMTWEPWGDPARIDPERSLLVRDLSVVEDPTRTRVGCDGASMGKWSFGYLMDQMALGDSPGDDVEDMTGAKLARRWLESLDTAASIDGWSVAPRPLVRERLLDPWIAASGGPGVQLDMSRAPFRLLAIVNRFDLRGAAAYGGLDAGELRFVFGALSPTCEPLPNFTVIFEFGTAVLPRLRGGCLTAQTWARQWKALDAYELGTPEYNAALEALTEPIVRRYADPTRTNGSALRRLRTNENAFDPSPGSLNWEQRELALRNFDAGLEHTDHFTTVAVAQTPVRERNRTSTLVAWVNAQARAIRAGRHLLPIGPPSSMLTAGGSSRYQLGTFWDGKTAADIRDREARHRFSLATCSGCHARETSTANLHIGPGLPGAPARLSGFLTGIDVTDPADGAPTRHFNDLERRATDLSALIATPCTLLIGDTILVGSH